MFLAHHHHPSPASWSAVARLMLMGAIPFFQNTLWFGPNMNLFICHGKRARNSSSSFYSFFLPVRCLPTRVGRLSPAKNGWLEVEKGLV